MTAAEIQYLPALINRQAPPRDPPALLCTLEEAQPGLDVRSNARTTSTSLQNSARRAVVS